MRKLLLFAVLTTLLQAQGRKTQTVKQDDYPLRAGCADGETQVARLRRGDAVKIRFALASGGRTCYSVSVDVDGNPVQGYVWADALTGLEEFEQSRQKASTAALVGRRVTGDEGLPPARPASAGARSAPAPAIAAARPIPDFSVPALDRPGTAYSSGSMRGKTYLLDFWATWCGPCVQEMPALQRAYDRFKYRNFEVLSVSLDNRPEDVAKFRQGQWKMPWAHGFAGGGWESEITRRFGIRSIPSPILVDASGNMVARGSELRGASLETTLARVLGN